MRRSAVLSLFVGLTLSACQEPLTDPTPVDARVDLAVASSQASVFDRGTAPVILPSGASVADLGGEAIDPADYACPASTDMFDWYYADFDEFIERDLDALITLYSVHWAEQIPMYEALYLYDGEGPQIFGYDGEFTNIMERTDRFARRFWDIDTDEIKLMALKGTMLTDVERVARAYQLLTFLPPYFGLDEADALAVATEIRETILGSEYLDGGNHSLFSFNAFAISFGDGTGKIVMGDGMLQGYAELGFGDVAAPAIYGHEFAHHIQFQNGYFSDPFPTAAERTRYTELMADAMSAYFLTHKRGMTMNRHRVAEFLSAFYQIGDCGFSSSGHHGTPNQRMRAAQFGFDIADQAQKNGHILSSQEFYELFVAEYPNIIAPDA